MNAGIRSSCALAVCAAGVILCAQTQRGPGFPVYPPTLDADPSVQHPVEVSIPSRLKVEQMPGSMSVAYDLASLRTVKIMVGKHMTIGMKDEFRVYPEGEARPVSRRGLSMSEVKELSSPNFRTSTEILTFDHDGIPAPGTRYAVEHDVALFETDIPAQHMWMPESGKKYKVLWEEKLNGVE